MSELTWAEMRAKSEDLFDQGKANAADPDTAQPLFLEAAECLQQALQAYVQEPQASYATVERMAVGLVAMHHLAGQQKLARAVLEVFVIINKDQISRWASEQLETLAEAIGTAEEAGNEYN